MEKLLNLDEVAEILQVNKRTVQRYCYEKILPAFKIAGGEKSSYRIRESDLKSFIDNRIKEHMKSFKVDPTELFDMDKEDAKYIFEGKDMEERAHRYAEILNIKGSIEKDKEGEK